MKPILFIIGFSFVMGFGFESNALLAQDNRSIQLLDADLQMPVTGATYSYADQHGITDTVGKLYIHYVKDAFLQFSHIAYGQWELNDEEVKAALNEGRLTRKKSIKNLYPVTVIAVHSAGNEHERLTLEYQDKLSHDGGEILNHSASINGIRKSGSYGYDPVLRGFKYDQLNIVLNGAQCATAACPNRMDPPTSQMAPNMTDRVEILKGPHALRYGNSFGGTINYIQGRPKFSSQLNPYGRISSGYETNGSIWQTEGQVGVSGKKADFSLFGSYGQGENYTDGEGLEVAAGFNRTSVGAKLGLKLGERQTLTVSANNNLAKDVDFPALPMDLRSDNTWMINAGHKIEFSQRKLASWETLIYTTLVDHEMDNLSKNLNPRMVDAWTNAETANYGGRTEGHWNFSSSSLYSGVDFRLETADGIRTRTFLMGPNNGKTVYDNVWQNSSITKIGWFGEYRMNRGTWDYQLALRINYNKGSSSDVAPEFETVNTTEDETQINPSASIGALNTINQKMNWGVWLGRAQRSGSIAERYINYFPIGQDPYEMVGNPALDPEVNNQLDVAFNYQTEKIRVSLDVFASYLQNYISSEIDTSLSPRMPTSPGVRRFVNLGEAFRTGFEIGFAQKLPAGLDHKISAAFTYGQDLERDEPLPEIAPFDLRYTLKGVYFNQQLIPEISFRYVGEQSRIAEEYGETVSPSFALLDAKISYRPGQLFRVTAGVSNIFDTAYYEHLNRSVRGTMRPIYAPGRNYFITLTFDLK